MLNPTFSSDATRRIERPYVAPADIAEQTAAGNAAFETGTETRLQPVFTEEIWEKLRATGFADKLAGDVLEVCGGTGFLTYHLLARVRPKSLTVNDISPSEIAEAQQLISAHYPAMSVRWAVGDMHTLDFGQTFDVIIGNSFLHHFHNVPHVLTRFAALLRPGGCFISLHEPTPMATVVESAKLVAYPLAVVAPGFVNNLARARHRGPPSPTDIWLFEPRGLRDAAIAAGFSQARTQPWNLRRPIDVQRHSLHLGPNKPRLSSSESDLLLKAIHADAWLRRILPSRFFGALSLVCVK